MENTPLSPEAQAVLSASHTDPQVVADILRAVVLKCVCTDDYGSSYVDPQDLLAIADELEAL